MNKFLIASSFLLLITYLPTSTMAQQPSITSFAPSSGTVGTLVTISGTNLSNPTAIIIGGTAAIIISNTGTSLVAMVMPEAQTGLINITTPLGSTLSSSYFAVLVAAPPSVQQGNKLVGSGAINIASLGPVSLSADGNTAIVGGPNDNTSQGAAWIFTRSGSLWSQQGNKLVGTGNVGAAKQGGAVCLSADGNTAIIGGTEDSNGRGAAWIFTRNGNTWSQQGNKLVGIGGIGPNIFQGMSVSLSADGNTAIMSGDNDNYGQGAVWIFTRNGNTWNQQGNKLVGTGNTVPARQGISVDISADGNTAIVGGYPDNGGQGAAWIFIRNGSAWSQQGSKLSGTGSVGAPIHQGYSVSLSADGNTAIVGGFLDNSNQGAAWIFTRTGNIWNQQGNKLVGTGNIGIAHQGHSVSLSADGNTAIIGGYYDNNLIGATWIYKRNGNMWSQQGSKLVGLGNVGTSYQGHSVGISADWKTAIVGGFFDDNLKGAAWIFASLNVPCSIPPLPIVSVVQPTCTVSTGSILITSPISNQYTYSLNGSSFDTTKTFSALAVGTYTVAVKNDSGCVNSISVVVNTAPGTPPAPTVSTTQPSCTVATGTITITAPLGTGLSYSIDGVDYSNTTGVFNPANGGTYNVTVRNNNGCTSAATVAVINTDPVIPPAPTVAMVQPTCPLPSGTITVTFPIANATTYSIDGVTYIPNNVFTGLAPNTYSVTVNNGNCISPATVVTLNAITPLVLSLSASPNPISAGNAVSLVVTGSRSFTVTSWLPLASFTNQSATTQSIVVNTPQTFTVTGKTTDDCADTAQVLVTLKTAEEIYIPNTFTPDNNGLNDVFKVYGTSIDRLELTIWNQWGEKIFSTNDKNDGWNGKSNGKLQPTGVYIYVAKVTLLSGKEVVKKGMVNLFR